MGTPRLRQVRLTAFKSFRDAVLPIDDVTVLTGRNSSGKSNALDGIEVLARLMGGETLSDALDGRRRAMGPIRGGSIGCAPHGMTSFDLGCTVDFDGDIYEFDVTIEVVPELRVKSERLCGPAPMIQSNSIQTRPLYQTLETVTSETAIWAETHNGLRGNNPHEPFRDSRLIASQIHSRVSGGDKAGKAILRGTEAVAGALRGVFHLDPVPHLMRDYVPERDSELRRTAENLSAALAGLRRADPETFERITELVRQVADRRIREISVTRSELGDVMLALREVRGPRAQDVETTPAREMSDGLLRFLAVATALLTSNRGLDIDTGIASDPGDALMQAGVLIVIEEIENGLHPSQAQRVLELIRETSSDLGTGVLVTTHSPALLDALEGELNENVIVCYRGESGGSELRRLTDLSGYAAAMARGSLGDVVTRGHLTGPEEVVKDYSAFAAMLGLAQS